jgi:hypothetical protein
MPYDKELAERIRHVLRERSDVTEREMFGGLGFLSAGRMYCGILGGDLIVRIADDEFQAVMRRPHIRLMDFTGKPLRGFVYVSPPGGCLECLDMAHPADQCVPSGENLGHHLKVAATYPCPEKLRGRIGQLALGSPLAFDDSMCRH